MVAWRPLPSDGTFTYAPETVSSLQHPPLPTHTPSTTLSRSDTHGDTASATVTITLNVPAETVTANADFATAADDGGIISGNVLANDSADDLTSEERRAGQHTRAMGATVTLDSDGTFTYDPENGSSPANHADASHTYTRAHSPTDTHGDTASATVTITLNVPAETVTANADFATAADDGGIISGNVLANDSADDLRS